MIHAAISMQYDEFQKLSSLGKSIYIYNEKYNGLIDLIQLCPEDLYAKLEILLETQIPNIYDTSMKSALSWIIFQKKIPVKDKLNFIKLFEGKVPTEDIKTALFSVDISGNTLLSLVLEYDNLDLFTSILDFMQYITQMQISQILNYSNSQHANEVIFKTPQYLQNIQLRQKKSLRFPRLKLHENFTPKNLLEVSIEMKSKLLVEYLITKGYSISDTTRSGLSITAVAFQGLDIDFLQFLHSHDLLDLKECINLARLAHLQMGICLNSITNSIMQMSLVCEIGILSEVLFSSRIKLGILAKVIRMDNPQYFGALM